MTNRDTTPSLRNLGFAESHRDEAPDDSNLRVGATIDLCGPLPCRLIANLNPNVRSRDVRGSGAMSARTCQCEPVTVSVAARRPAYATVEVTDLSSEVPGPPFTQPAPVSEEPRPVMFDGLPPALYRVTVAPQSPAHPRVSDYVLIDSPPG